MKFQTYLALFLAAALTLGAGITPAFSAAPLQEDVPPAEAVAEYVPQELIIGFTNPKLGDLNAAESETFKATLLQVNGEVALESVDGSWVLAHFQSDADTEAAIQQLSQSENIAYVERNAITNAATAAPAATGRNGEAAPEVYVPDDPQKTGQWYLNKILYFVGPTPSGTHPCVVLFDSGVNYNHSDLLTKIFKGRDLIQNDNDPMDTYGQGTAAAGVIGAKTNNTNGIAAVSPSSNILAIRVLGGNGKGTTAQLAYGIGWANKYASTTNCGGQNPKIYAINAYGPASSAIASAISAASKKGRLLLAAAGDTNTATKQYPAAYANVFGIAATDQNNNRTYSSNYDTGTNIWVDVAAPGYSILSTKMDGSYESRTGTSMSTSIIAGAAARVWAKNPSFTAAQVMSKIMMGGALTNGGFPRKQKQLDLLTALGNGSSKIIQGIIMDTYNRVKPIDGAKVVVKAGSKTICTLTTNASGHYTCVIPANGTYSVTASKTGFITDYNIFSVTNRLTTANIPLSLVTGTSASNDWSVSIYWKYWQPYELGKEMDLHVVKNTATPECSYNTNPIKYTNVDTGNDSYESSQMENIRIFKAYGGTVQVWVSLWDQGPWNYKSRIGDSEMYANIYKNNKRIARLNVPKNNTDTRADIWFIGTINLNTGAWGVVNQILPDDSPALPSCIYTYKDPF